MSTKDRARAAITAMKQFGFPGENIVKVLKELLNNYGNEWLFIEENNYQVLLDAILAAEDERNNGKKNHVRQADQERHTMVDAPSSTVERLDRSTPIQKRLLDLPSTSRDDVLLKKRKKEPGLANGHNRSNSLQISPRLMESAVQSHVQNSLVPASKTSKIPSDLIDICNGYENVLIPIISGSSKILRPPAFRYISENTVYQNGSINFDIAGMIKKDRCTDSHDDCLSTSPPCKCAKKTNGKFAYTPEGLLTQKFIEAYLSMGRRTVRHPVRYYSCFDQDRKFIKECWRMCKCSTQNCGNRVVQRGITAKLQVFLKADGKNWGLRTAEKLQQGAFVCEYVGEILTSSEAFERMCDASSATRSAYPVPLHANGGLKAEGKGREGLWLDAESYGNVARFINHRCHDANLVEIPVEVETTNDSYYHVALFTNRKVEALDELTLDYGLEFNDNQQKKVYRCSCGGKNCRDARNQGTRSKMLAQ